MRWFLVASDRVNWQLWVTTNEVGWGCIKLSGEMDACCRFPSRRATEDTLTFSPFT